MARAGSSLAAARPGGYRDGAEDATTVPSAATATTAVTAMRLRIGPVTAGTTSVPADVGEATPGRAGWRGSPSTVAVRWESCCAYNLAVVSTWACKWAPFTSAGTWKPSTSPSTSTTTANVTRTYDAISRPDSPHALRRTRSSTSARYLRALTGVSLQRGSWAPPGA